MKKTSTPKTYTQLVDVVALLVSVLYMQSVLTVAHHTSMWAHDGTTRIVESPYVLALVVSALLAAYSWHKKRTFSVLSIISLTILATSSLFWLSGLRANFHF